LFLEHHAITAPCPLSDLEAQIGKVHLLCRDELANDWDSLAKRRLPVWEVTQYLIHTLQQRGEMAAAELLAPIGGVDDVARALAYCLYTLCERKDWAQETLPYNSPVIALAGGAPAGGGTEASDTHPSRTTVGATLVVAQLVVVQWGQAQLHSHFKFC
jgi:hypothetical protein